MPASLNLIANCGSSARLIPLVLSWMWSTPSSFIIRMIVGKSSLIVGSPPVIWTEFPGTGLSDFSVLAISLITNMAVPGVPAGATHEEVMEMGQAGAARLVILLGTLLPEIA